MRHNTRRLKAAATKLPVVLALAFTLSANLSCGTARKVEAVYSSDSTFDAEPQRVIIVSFDGLRPDAMESTETVHLHSLRAAGAYQAKAKSVLPSITLVNHASMVSGVGPAKHGILWNTYEPENGTITVPTVFDLAKQKGMSTAMVAGKEKFQHLNRPGTIDHMVIDEGSAESLAESVSEVLRVHQPQLMMIHFRFADTAGHDDGWMSPSQLEAISEADQAFGRILTTLKDLGLQQSTAILVSADHGGHDHTHGSDSEVDMTIPWIATGAGIPERGALTRNITTYDTAATAAQLLKLPIPADWDGVSVF